MNGKSQVVQVNRLKRTYNSEIWKPKQKSEILKRQPKRKATKPEEWEEDEVPLSSHPLLKRAMPERRHEPQTPPSQVPDTPGSAQETLDPPIQNVVTLATNPLGHRARGENSKP